MRFVLHCLIILFVSCGFPKKEEGKTAKTTFSTTLKVKAQDSIRIAYAFDFPVGKPGAKGYYNAQSFGENNHLGDDWNAVTGGNSDLGDPIYSIANGKVVFAEDLKGGWGKLVRLVHYLPDGSTYESVFAHCETLRVNKDDWVTKGEQIATIGNADGVYLAHLHFEIRDSIGMQLGVGYSENQKGYVDPTAFIKAHRKVR